mgnify:CR=1 FL=1|tara:strand:+ start:823 stop:2049 length:1227 start_codon:yes stop_codon:yes gene_type:complete
MSSEEPLQRVVQYALQEICEFIKAGETEGGNARVLLRRCFVNIIHVLPITCRTLHSEAHLHDAFEPVLYYERVRLGLCSTHFFLDGLPSGLTLFMGPTSINLPDEDVKKLKMRDIVADRLQTIGKLELMAVDLPRKVHLISTHHPDDLSTNIPGPVRVFVSRCRSMIRTMRRLKKAALFVQCSNCNCNRCFYSGEPSESWAHAPVSEEADEQSDDEDEHSSNAYWQIATGGGIATKPDTQRFCCQACADQHSIHLKCMMPDNNLALDSDDGAKKSGRARVGEAFRLALRRNEMAARALRNSKSRSRTNLAVSPEELRQHRNLRITALNVDLGVLYASSLIAESATMCRGKVLPGSAMYWRDDPLYYSKTLAGVFRIYNTVRREEGIISNLLTMPKFLEVVSSRSSKLL